MVSHTFENRECVGHPAADRPANEAARIRTFGEILKAQAPRGFTRSVAHRVDTIVSGRGSIRGITFDFNQLGVSDAD